ncbi:sulfite exporter TauE/SafE family protein, partial [Ferrovum myxofaciens]|uniref:sulfite exporter TauE/SafE family protein n=1 Tax=Ferrovum myxofaciens TaxID=416213 RepID=UPI00190F1292
SALWQERNPQSVFCRVFRFFRGHSAGFVVIGLAHAGLGALTGLAIGLTGVGGGALMAPALIFWFGVEPQSAIATDLWFAVLTKLVAVKAHHGEG